MDPRNSLKLSPFEILYGRPFKVPAWAGESINALKYLAAANYVKTLGIILTSVHDLTSNRPAYPTEIDGNFIVAGEASAYLILSK